LFSGWRYVAISFSSVAPPGTLSLRNNFDRRPSSPDATVVFVAGLSGSTAGSICRVARARRGLLVAGLLALGVEERQARAQDTSEPRPAPTEAVAPTEGAPTEPPSNEAPAGSRSTTSKRDHFARPYGLVEFGIGIMALPDAKLCGGAAGCDRGDVSVEVDAWPMFRASPHFAVGAGITLALIPMQDVPRRDTVFPREHARRYFTAEGIGRYYFLHGPALEVWSGISAGLIVVSDNFRTDAKDPAVTIIGAESANIATEGMSLGLASGVTFGVNPHLQVGATLRFANWYLPPTPEVIAFGESASLSNRVTMLNLALTVAYHSR
jgi:hypothetical protein